MKPKLFFLMLLGALVTEVATSQNKGCVADGEVRVISYNIRLGTAQDGGNSWEYRRDATLRLFEQETPCVVGVQEALDFQVAYIEQHLPQYEHVGVGRDDGKHQGEIMAIFFLRDRYDLLEHGDFWLSETPDQVSRGWDGACNRTVTWVKLQEKSTGKVFYYFNTHLDHKGRVARREGVKLLVERVRSIAGNKSCCIVGGDLNSTIQDKIFAPLLSYMTSARNAPISDDKGSYNGWGQAPNSMLIDHLFVRNIKLLSFCTLDGDYGVNYISDHYPIEVEGKLK
jgi:endonuclease/exonuclease/phosphatase family metal-dependent hydrolase